MVLSLKALYHGRCQATGFFTSDGSGSLGSPSQRCLVSGSVTWTMLGLHSCSWPSVWLIGNSWSVSGGTLRLLGTGIPGMRYWCQALSVLTYSWYPDMLAQTWITATTSCPTLDLSIYLADSCPIRLAKCPLHLMPSPLKGPHQLPFSYGTKTLIALSVQKSIPATSFPAG